jgi:hypothetical protein
MRSERAQLSAPGMGLTASSSDHRHLDAHLLSSLEGPAVMATVAGVLRSPPKNAELVAFVLGNVHCVLGLDPQWESVLESLHNFEPFMQKLVFLDQATVTPSRLDQLLQRQKVCPEAFDPDDIVSVSHACAMFAMWVNAVHARGSQETW